jgi:catechol 2,3-dioxygenase-like lactoylglutathione lyase family enzyme
MRIYVTSVHTNTLGFKKKTDIPLGDASWLTVVSPEQPDGTELLLEPSGHPAVKPFKDALVEDGIPATSFAVDDVPAEFDRLRSKGVRFTPGTDRDGQRHHGRLRRHLRQSHPDRAADVVGASRGRFEASPQAGHAFGL